MKSINIEGREFQYKVFKRTSDFIDYYETRFYQGIEEVLYKKYGFFGKKIPNKVPILVFELPFNIEDERYSKKELKERLLKEITLLDRKEEIKRGELI